MKRIIIVYGNGCTNVKDANWYESVRSKLSKSLPHVSVVLPQMPDPHVARESIWVPYLLEVGVDENTVLVGHSSGAEAIMRLAEENTVGLLVLVSACHTDLGDANERASGYYSRPWQWEKIKKNAKRGIVQWASKDDPLVPYATEQMFVHKV